MKKLFIIGLFASFISNAQDIHLSQIAFSTQLINPAAYGNHDGWERFGIHQKNQNLSTGKYSTSLFYFDGPLFKSHTAIAKSHFGFGLQVYNDMSGNGTVANRGAKIGFSSILPVSKTSIVSFGVEGGIAQQTVDFSRLNFGNQFQGVDFNSNLSSHEGTLMNFNKVSPELAAGFMYRFKNYPRVLNSKSNFWFQTGISAYHLLNSGAKLQQYDLMLPRKFVFHAEMENMIGDRLLLNVKFNQYVQQKQYQSILSAIISTQVNNHSLVTTHNKPFRIGGGVTYRLMDAIIPTFMLEWNEFVFLASTDLRTSKLANSRMGGFEFSIKYARGNHSISSKSILFK
ncbi:MAG: PorP/SprF family type IX secretion system membrane protein [Flavobacteriia bacterium]|nr:PorP/SprF family type IX secretion system membrane protein [Flavobacteriia bacterium]